MKTTGFNPVVFLWTISAHYARMRKNSLGGFAMNPMKLAGLKPACVFGYFEKICSIPVLGLIPDLTIEAKNVGKKVRR